MKFFITNPVGYYGKKHILAPIGPLCIATIAKKSGCQVIFQDAYLENPSFDVFKEKLRKYRPEIIGVSCNVEDRLAAIKTAKVAKEIMPSSLVIMGGPFPTMAHEEIIQKLSFVDIVVRHEGEKQIEGLIDFLNGKKLLENIKGITYRNNQGEMIINSKEDLIANLNNLPMPDFSMLKIFDYKSYIPPEEIFQNMDKVVFVSQEENKRPMASLIFSRGCPYNCLFCSAKAMWQRRYRIISPERALSQVRFFVKKGIFDFVFQDDHLLADREWFVQFSDGLKELSQKSQELIRFACSSRVDALDEDIIKKFYQSGGRIITLGIENLSNRVLRLMNKEITVEQIWQVLEILRNNKIIVRGGILIETPGERFEDIAENIRNHSRLRKYLIQAGTMLHLRIYPGSPLEKVALEKGQHNFSWVENYHSKRNYLIDAPAHIPVYENIPHEKIIPFLVYQSLKVEDYYLSRNFIRQFLKSLRGKEDVDFISKIKRPYLCILGILKYLFAFNFVNRFKFLWRVLTIKE